MSSNAAKRMGSSQRRAAAEGSRPVADSQFRVPLDVLGRVAGLTALASAILVAAGFASTLAYLSAWDLPPAPVRLDPITAALHADPVAYCTIIVCGLCTLVVS